MAETHIATSRRALLAGIMVGAPALITSPATAIPLPGKFASMSQWNAAMVRFERAQVAHDEAFDWRSEVEDRYDAIAPKRPRDDITIYGNGKAFTIEEACAKTKAEHHAWKSADEACRVETGLFDAEKAQASACCEEDDALLDLLRTPAPDLAAVAYKIEIAGKYSKDIADLRPVIDDLERLKVSA